MNWTRIWICLLLLFALQAEAQQSIRFSRTPVNRRYIPVKQDHKWGYADTNQRILITPQFDMAYPFQGKVAVVEIDEKAYAIDSSGKIITPGFDQLEILNDSTLAIYLNEVSDSLGGWGLSSIKGVRILPPAYEEVAWLNRGFFQFRKDSLWGIVNRNGQVLVRPNYNSISVTPYGSIILQKGKKFGALSVSGNRVLEDKYIAVYCPGKNSMSGCITDPANKKKRLWGTVNNSGETIIPFQFDTIYRINTYFIGAQQSDSIAVYFPAVNGNGTLPVYKEFRTLGLYWIYLYDFNANCGVADTSGRMLVPCIYANVKVGGLGTWFTSDTTDHWGMYSVAGTELMSPQWDYIQPFRFAVTVAKKNGQSALINFRGEIVEPLSDQEIIVRSNSVKLLRKDGSVTFLTYDQQGNIIDRSIYDELSVIKLGPKNPGPAIRNTNTGPGFNVLNVPAVDSLEWVYKPKLRKYALVNVFTRDTLIPPVFDEVSQINFSLVVNPDGTVSRVKPFAIVEVREITDAVDIDEYQTKSYTRKGLVDMRTGKIVLQPQYSVIFAQDLTRSGFRGCVRTVLPDGQMALVTTDGTEKQTFYTWIDSPQNGYARYCTGGKWSLEGSGEIISSLDFFCTMLQLFPKESFGPACYLKSFMERNVMVCGGKWGFVDTAGTVIIQPEYDGARTSMAGTAIVRKGKKWGLIDMQNTIRIPCEFDALRYVRMKDTVMVITQTNGIRYGYIDRFGNMVIPADLKQIKALGGGLIGFSRTGKWGVMNSAGATVCNELYMEILPFSDGFAAVRKGARWGYIDTTGQELISPAFDKAGAFHEGLARAVIKGRWGYIDKTGKEVITAQYMQAGDFCGGAAPVRTRDGFGLIGRDGKWLIKPEWRSIVQLDSNSTGYFVISNDFLSGICRSDGKILIYPRFNKFKMLGEGCIAFLSGTRWGMVDTTGRQLLAADFEMIKPFSEHLAPACQQNKWGYIKPNGGFAIRPIFDYASGFNDKRAYVLLGRQSMFIDPAGKVLLLLKRDFALMGYSEGKYVVGKIDFRTKEIVSMYYLTRHGVVLSRFEYKEAKPFMNNRGRIRSWSGTWGLVSYTGFYVVKPRFYMIGNFDRGIAPCKMIYSLGLHSLSGETILADSYDSIRYDEELRLIQIDKNNAVGWLFPDGRICWPESE